MSGLYWEPTAGNVYRTLDRLHPSISGIVENILDILESDPGSPAVRRISLRTSHGITVWGVPIRYADYEWRLLWQFHPTRASDVLVVYLGPTGYGR